MGGPGSGPVALNVVRRAYAELDKRLPSLFGALADRAMATANCPSCGAVIKGLGPDREAAIYLIDRRLGRPRQEIDQRVTAQVQLSGDDYAVLARALAVEAKLLTATPVLEGEKPTEIYENLQSEAENVSDDGSQIIQCATPADTVADWTPPTPPDTSDITDITRFRAQPAAPVDQEQQE